MFYVHLNEDVVVDQAVHPTLPQIVPTPAHWTANGVGVWLLTQDLEHDTNPVIGPGI